MGCDIHENFEVKQEDGTWHPLFPRVPENPWWDYIVDDMLDNGAGAVLTFSNDRQTGQDALIEQFNKLTVEEAIARYGHRHDFSWAWQKPSLAPIDANYRYPEIGDRNYRWFGHIAGVRSPPALPGFQPRGMPADVCREIGDEYRRWQGDAHTASWLMVSEILAQSELAGYIQYRWLTTFVPDPENTRMVFYFDN